MAANPSNEQPKSLADLVLDPKAYSAILRAQDGHHQGAAADVRSSKASANLDAHPSTTSSSRPNISLTDLILNNVTYDAILASSTKGLSMKGDLEHPSVVAATPLSATFPPPNTPIDASASQQRSLEQVMEEAIRVNSSK
ncbi:hypothetical protein ONZ45_g7385 [Pleurotus djamor]|nr:hypothetical protein ONZ45_g7385 [Pleurotus djamor]